MTLRHLLAAATLLIASVSAVAQVSPAVPGPPQCPSPRKASPHPTAEEIAETQAKATADPTVLLSPEPVGNMGVLRYAVRDYADCTLQGRCYWQDLAAQAARAREVLDATVRTLPKGMKKAMVLDIDETSLSSYCEEINEDFGYIPDRFEAWIVSKEASIPIRSTLELAKHAQALGVDVFFITGRPESQRAVTEANLKAAGYSGWKRLSLKQAGVTYASTASYKAGERQKILDEKYTIVMNMGDQWSDLQGVPVALHSVKLPNPFYYLP